MRWATVTSLALNNHVYILSIRIICSEETQSFNEETLQLFIELARRQLIFMKKVECLVKNLPIHF